MKRVLIIYSREGRAEDVARGIKKGAEEMGHRAEIMPASEKGEEISFHPYDLVIVGSPKKGLIRGSPASDIAPTLSRCKRTVGQDCYAYITPSIIGSTKALRELMEEMEKLGCVVRDFATLKKESDGIEFARDRIGDSL